MADNCSIDSLVLDFVHVLCLVITNFLKHLQALLAQAENTSGCLRSIQDFYSYDLLPSKRLILFLSTSDQTDFVIKLDGS